MKGVRINYSEKELQWIKMNCTLPISELHKNFCEKFNRKDVKATNLAALRKRKGWLTGRTGCFEKGNKAWNDGMKGWDAGGRSSETRFKKGEIPKNHKPVGSERIDNKDGYVMVKTAEPRTWRPKHVVEWEKIHGKVPKGHKLWFIDNDTSNWKPSNMMLVSEAENATVNFMGLNKVPAEAKATVLLIAKVKLKAKDRIKKQQEQSK